MLQLSVKVNIKKKKEKEYSTKKYEQGEKILLFGAKKPLNFQFLQLQKLGNKDLRG